MPIPQPRVLLISGAVLVALVFILSLIYFEAIPLSRVFSFRPIVGLGPQTPSVLPACPSEKEGNPLVEEILKTGDFVVGTLKGKIETVDPSPEGREAVIDIKSLDGKQSYTFGMEEKEGLVYDSLGIKDAKLLDLKTGHTISVTFNCNVQEAREGNLGNFNVSRIAIVEK